MAKSLATTVATPAKCVGRLRALESLRDTAPTDTVVTTALRVHLLGRRREDEVGAARLGQRDIALEVARVRGEVLGRRELQRVDEDA